MATVDTGALPREELIEMLELLAYIKRRSLSFMREWASSSPVAELRSGLEQQIPQEEHHLEAIRGRLHALGVQEDPSYRDPVLEEAFEIIASAPQEVEKLAGFYRSIKEYTVARCGHLLALSDPDTQQLADQIVEDENRFQRWGEVLRLRLSPTPELQRDGNLMRARIMEYTAKSREHLALRLQERSRRIFGKA